MTNKIFNLCCYLHLIFLLIAIGACDKPETVSFTEKEVPKVTSTSLQEERIKIVVGAMITPSTGYAYYRQLLDYIGEKLDKKVDFIAQESYQEANILLKNQKVHAAFICGLPYVEGHDEYGLEILVAPQVAGKTTYHSYIIVHKDSSLSSIDSLRGKSFAFADPNSNSGKLVPAYVLAKMGETPNSFFSKFVYTYGHDKSIKAVARKISDGAAVDSLIYDYMITTGSKYASDTKIIFRSEPYGIPPVVVPRNINPELKKQLRSIFLNIHNKPRGSELLKGMAIDRFIEVDDNAYDGIRKIKNYIKEKGAKGK